MTNSCRRPAMRWSEVTGAIARHKRASTQCGRLNTFASVSPWTCSGISRRPIEHRPRRPCIRPVLGRKNSKNDATVSKYLDILAECRDDRNMAYHMDELLRIGSCGGEKKSSAGGPPMSSKPDFIR